MQTAPDEMVFVQFYEGNRKNKKVTYTKRVQELTHCDPKQQETRKKCMCALVRGCKWWWRDQWWDVGQCGGIQTGQSFTFANRARDKSSACSSTDRKHISLLLPPLSFFHSLSFSLSPSSSFSWQLVYKEGGLSRSHRQCCHQAATAQQLISLQLLLKGQAGTGR